MAKRSFILSCLLASSLFLFSQSTTGFAPGKGVEIYYEIYGAGEPMVIINGGPGFNSQGFQPLAEKLSARYQVILYDQRGTGRSKMDDISAENMTMELMAEDLEALRRHLGFQEWVVLGHSFGGIMGNYYISKYPAAVKAMIASASGGIDLGLLDDFDITRQMTDTQRDSFLYWNERLLSGDTAQLVQKKRRAFMATAYIYNDDYAPQIAERLGQSNMYINQLIWQDLRSINYNTKADAAKFQKPILIIQGREDVISPKLGEAAHDAFPKSQLVMMPKCGHYGWLDQPELYFGSIHSFMDDLNATDEKDISTVLTNYVRAIYEADSNLVYSVTDTTLQKSGHYYAEKPGKWRYLNMTFEQLVQTADRYNRNGHLPADAPLEVEVFDISSQTASAKVSAVWGFDYVLLSQDKWGQWTMDKVLWQSYDPDTQQALRAQTH